MIFAQPAFLWGLLALAIPVAIHLFNFRRYRKVYFSNVDRLDSLQTRSRRQSELRRWLVLAARLLAVAAVVLAFARPTIPGREATLRSGSTVVSLFLDNSFSMEAQSADGSLLDQGRAKVREIASAYGPATRFQLVTSDLGGDQFRWLGREELLEALDAVTPSPASPAMAHVAARQLEFLRQSGAPNRHAYLVSDFQRGGGDPSLLPSDSLALVTLVPLEGVAADNLYIDTLRLDAPAYFSGGTVAVEATVRNSGSRDAEGLPVRLLVGGRERALATLDIPAGSSAKATLRFALDSSGWADGTVEITDYPVTFDDRYHFAIPVGQPVAMLEVDGQGSNPSLRKLFEADSAVRHSTGPLPPDLADLHFIVLNEPSSVPSGQAQALAEWVRQGGTLAIVPPAGGASAALDDLLLLLGAPTLGPWQQQTLKAASVDCDAALYRNVFSAATADLEMPTVQGHYRLALGQAACQRIITLADGSPLLCATPCGAGRVYLFATPLSAEWTDFVAQALFVPTLYNMALYSRPLPPPSHTLGSDAPIALQLRHDPSERPPELTGPDGFRLLPDLRQAGTRTVMVPHGDIVHDGFYRIDGQHLAFNHSRRESALDFYSRDEVAAAASTLPGYSVVRHADRPLDRELLARTGGTPLWRWCLLLALLALAAETLLIRRPWSSK